MSKSALLQKLERHFRDDPAALPVVEQHFAVYERPNLHLAIEELVRSTDPGFTLSGIVNFQEYNRASLARLSRKASAKRFDEGPVEYVDVALHGDQRLACVKNGLYLFREGGQPLALLLEQEQHWSQQVLVEVMAPDREVAERCSRQLTRRTRHGQAFRGHVLSLEEDCHGQLHVHFHHLPQIARDVSGAFIRELLRKAAVFAAEEDGEPSLLIRDCHIDEALGELLVAGGPLTQSLLGAKKATSCASN